MRKYSLLISITIAALLTGCVVTYIKNKTVNTKFENHINNKPANK